MQVQFQCPSCETTHTCENYPVTSWAGNVAWYCSEECALKTKMFWTLGQ